MSDYNPQKRTHNIPWIMKHSETLFHWAKETQDTTLVLYCCFELRNVLEIIELQLLYASVSDDNKRMEILESAKPKDGIKQVNEKLKTLKHKYQTFYDCIGEIIGIETVYFSFSKSKDFKYELSNYIHTYTRFEEEMLFESEFIKKAIILIPNVISFIDKALMKDEGGYKIQNIDKMEEEYRILLDEWKSGIVKNEEELKQRIIAIIERRKQKETMNA